MKRKLVVMALDALCSSDIAIMKTLPNFRRLLAEGSYVRHLRPVYPSLTYPCHVSIMTGTYVDRHGIYHNEKLCIGDEGPIVFDDRRKVKGLLFTDYAKAHGFQTCALSWPVTAFADIDLNMPMIVPLDYYGDDPRQFFTGAATEQLLDRYYKDYGKFLMGRNRNLDRYTMALAPDIIRDYQQPDVMFIKLCDLDTVRHNYGVYAPETIEQLRKHDREFGIIRASVERYGDPEHTAYIIVGDHGQSPVERIFNPNVFLKQQGFIRTTASDQLRDYDAYAFSCSLSAWIKLRNPQDTAMRQRILTLLQQLQQDPRYGIDQLFTKAMAAERFHLTGPFDFIIESNGPLAFGTTYHGDAVFGDHDNHDYKTALASHGGLPERCENTTLIAAGAGVRKNTVIAQASLVDVAPTLAALLNFTMDDTDGHPLAEMLVE